MTMADKTVYPFGTGGQLPANIGVIDDLITGGADNALSAEQGKLIGELGFRMAGVAVILEKIQKGRMLRGFRREPGCRGLFRRR